MEDSKRHIKIQRHCALILGGNNNGYSIISEFEYKYDPRDGTYKFMGISLRSTAWNRVGHLSGVNLHRTQYLDALGLPNKYKINRK